LGDQLPDALHYLACMVVQREPPQRSNPFGAERPRDVVEPSPRQPTKQFLRLLTVILRTTQRRAQSVVRREGDPRGGLAKRRGDVLRVGIDQQHADLGWQLLTAKML